MKPATIGIRVHSGWGALVALSGKAGAEEVIERSRVVIIDPKISGIASLITSQKSWKSVRRKNI